MHTLGPCWTARFPFTCERKRAAVVHGPGSCTPHTTPREQLECVINYSLSTAIFARWKRQRDRPVVSFPMLSFALQNGNHAIKAFSLGARVTQLPNPRILKHYKEAVMSIMSQETTPNIHGTMTHHCSMYTAPWCCSTERSSGSPRIRWARYN